MWGAQARMALNTPVRLVSMVSLHCVASIEQIDPMVEIPALATRMSNDPSEALAPSANSNMASRSRTSTVADTHRRPCSSTSCTVSTRSSGVANE